MITSATILIEILTTLHVLMQNVQQGALTPWLVMVTVMRIDIPPSVTGTSLTVAYVQKGVLTSLGKIQLWIRPAVPKAAIGTKGSEDIVTSFALSQILKMAHETKAAMLNLETTTWGNAAVRVNA